MAYTPPLLHYSFEAAADVTTGKMKKRTEWGTHTSRSDWGRTMNLAAKKDLRTTIEAVAKDIEHPDLSQGFEWQMANFILRRLPLLSETDHQMACDMFRVSLRHCQPGVKAYKEELKKAASHLGLGPT